MLVSQILKTKGDLVFTASPAETVGAICALLYSRKVGAMVVMDGDRVVGIVSERDMVRAFAEEGAAALTKPISSCDGRNARPDRGDPRRFFQHVMVAAGEGAQPRILLGCA